MSWPCIKSHFNFEVCIAVLLLILIVVKKSEGELVSNDKTFMQSLLIAYHSLQNLL